MPERPLLLLRPCAPAELQTPGLSPPQCPLVGAAGGELEAGKLAPCDVRGSPERPSGKTLLSWHTGCGPFWKGQPVVYVGGFAVALSLALPLGAVLSHCFSQWGLIAPGASVLQGPPQSGQGKGHALTCFEGSQPAPAPLLGTCHVQRKQEGNCDDCSGPDSSDPRVPDWEPHLAPADSGFLSVDVTFRCPLAGQPEGHVPSPW